MRDVVNKSNRSKLSGMNGGVKNHRSGGRRVREETNRGKRDRSYILRPQGIFSPFSRHPNMQM